MSHISCIESNMTTTLPDEIIKKAGLKVGTCLIWKYDEARDQIVVMEKPQCFAKETLIDNNDK